MNIIQINKPGNSTIVSIIINTGSIHENPLYKGVSHFVEHCCFKGNPKRNQKQISSAIDNVGGILNAYTGSDLTVYWAKVGNTYKDLAKEVITELATQPLFPYNEVEKEREVILQEYKMGIDDIQNYPYTLLAKSIFEEYSSFYEDIIGTPETLSRINKSILSEYHKKYYQNPTLLIVGDIENYTNIESPLINSYIPVCLKPIPSDNYITRKNINQANIVLGNMVSIRGLSKTEQEYCSKLLDAIYSDMSGRLFDVIREQNHLVYRVHFTKDIYRNGFFFWAVSMGLDKENIDMARKLAIDTLCESITDEELDTAYIKAIGIEEMCRDNLENIAGTMANSLVKEFNYANTISDFKKELTKAKNNVREMQKQLNFYNNFLGGILPDEN